MRWRFNSKLLVAGVLLTAIPLGCGQQKSGSQEQLSSSNLSQSATSNGPNIIIESENLVPQTRLSAIGERPELAQSADEEMKWETTVEWIGHLQNTGNQRGQAEIEIVWYKNGAVVKSARKTTPTLVPGESCSIGFSTSNFGKAGPDNYKCNIRQWAN